MTCSRMSLVTLLILTLPILLPAEESCPVREIVTFNTGLVPSVYNYDTRRTSISKALKTVSADVMCLQEVWFEGDMKNIVNGLSDIFPYSWSPLHSSTLSSTMPETGVWDTLTEYVQNFWSSPCLNINSIPFLTCVLYRCSSAQSSLFQCVYENCFAEFFDLSQSCRTCLLVSAVDDIPSTLSRCLALFKTDNRLNLEGLLILSKYPITSIIMVPFLPGIAQLFPRAYLQVEVSSVGTVLCTHLTSDLSNYLDFTDEYPEIIIQAMTGISSSEEQQRAEIDRIIDKHQAPHFLVGDLNTGPAIPSKQIDGEFPNNYEILPNSGYENIYLTKSDSTCTFCADNAITNYNLSVVVDHVLAKGRSTVAAQRILESGVDGEILSDHYGLQVLVCAST